MDLIFSAMTPSNRAQTQPAKVTLINTITFNTLTQYYVK